MIKLETYTAKSFDLREFINKSTFDKYGNESLKLIDNRLIIIAQEVRNIIGKPITINNWHLGGQFNNSGLRDKTTFVGAIFSQHKFGKAIDIRSSISHFKIFELIMINEKYFMSLGVTRLEDPNYTKGNGLGWVHIDLKETGKKNIVIFKP